MIHYFWSDNSIYENIQDIQPLLQFRLEHLQNHKCFQK